MVFFNRKKKNVFICPMGGNLMELEQVPDPVFAQKLMEEGLLLNWHPVKFLLRLAELWRP